MPLPGAEIILTIASVSMRFGGVQALKDISFLVNKGEVLGLIGPNGSGKTTLFNVYAGDHKPYSGKVTFNDEDITNLPPFRICWKGIARTFQQPQPFRKLSVFENILVGKIFGGDKRRLDVDIDDIINLIGMGGKNNILVENLTGADQKKLEIGKALACKPALLLLDEVAAGLNQVEQEAIQKLVQDIRKNVGVTIIMIEHVMETIMSLSERIIVLNNGEILATGKPEEVAKNEKVIEAYLGKEFVRRAKS